MGDVKVAKEHLLESIDKMKKGEIEPAEFYKKMMSVLAELDVTNEDLKGVTPQLLSFVNGLLRNMS